MSSACSSAVMWPTCWGPLATSKVPWRYLAEATERDSMFSGQVLVTKFILDARQGILGDIDEALRKAAPMGWWRVKLVAAHAIAVNGDLNSATAMRDNAVASCSHWGSSTSSHSARVGSPPSSTRSWTSRASAVVTTADVPVQPVPVLANAPHGVRLTVMGGPITVHHDAQELAVPAGNPQRLVGVIVANGGSVSIDQASEALWGDDDVERSRTRLRNVLLRLRRVVGDIVVRTGNGLRLGPDVSCDLYDFRRQAEDALATARAPIPSWPASWRHGRWASETSRCSSTSSTTTGPSPRGGASISSGSACSTCSRCRPRTTATSPLRRRSPSGRCASTRYTDSRYVRLAELLAMQDRMAAAAAVLEDAAAVAREIGDGTSDGARIRREELMRRAASGG